MYYCYLFPFVNAILIPKSDPFGRKICVKKYDLNPYNMTNDRKEKHHRKKQRLQSLSPKHRYF